ncbi:MAG: hypothetical protein AAB316_06460 [Bacteroidota bacterium]
MEKLFVLTVSSKQYAVERLWYAKAQSLEDFANHILVNEKEFKDLLAGIGGHVWNRFSRPSPEEFLDAIADTFGEEWRFQIFELPLHQAQREAVEHRHREGYIPKELRFQPVKNLS